MSKSDLNDKLISPKRTSEPVRFLTSEDLLYPQQTMRNNNADIPLQEITVQGLLSFGEKTSFRLGRLNILVGPNGSGKSNLLDCIRLLRYMPLDIQEAFKDSGFEEWLYKGKTEVNHNALLQVTINLPFVVDGIVHQIRLGPPLHSRAPLEEVVKSNYSANERPAYFIGSYRSSAVLSSRSSSNRRRTRRLEVDDYDPFQSILSQIRDIEQYPEITRLADLYSNIRIYSEWSFGRNSVLRDSTPANRSDTRLSESMNDLPLALNGLENTAAHEKIRELLRDLKETYLDYSTRILFGRVGLELLESPLDYPLTASRLSDGTLRFLALAAILLNPDPPRLICIEEPELGMHPDMIRMVAGMIIDASIKTQIIITTHSEHLLSALQHDFDALIAFDAGISGSVVRNFSQDEYKNWSKDHSLGELWTSGELGGNRW
jgi:predicted ATPase